MNQIHVHIREVTVTGDVGSPPPQQLLASAIQQHVAQLLAERNALGQSESGSAHYPTLSSKRRHAHSASAAPADHLSGPLSSTIVDAISGRTQEASP